MEINFFGLIAVTRRAMDIMREQKPSGGLIQQVTSIGGQTGSPLFSIYCASKWAVEGFTEAISQEVKPEWKIKFQCVEPGGFRYVFLKCSQAEIMTNVFTVLTGPVDLWPSQRRAIPPTTT